MTTRANVPTNPPGWLESVPWMGLSVDAWLKLHSRHRFQTDLGSWPGALFDLACGCFNSALGLVQHLTYGKATRRAPLPVSPLFVVGHWRTGTTLLHELLSLDSSMRSPTTYECLAPHHFLVTGSWLPRLTRFTLPPTRAFDAVRVSWDAAQEDEFALCNLGLESPYAAIAFPNEGERDEVALELDELSSREQQRWRDGLASFLKQLVLFRPGRLLLKSPTHTFRLPTLVDMFPQAQWILTARNPYAVFASTVKLWRSLYVTYAYHRPDLSQLESQVIDRFARMHQRWRATSGLLNEQQLAVVRYEDLVHDPLATVHRVYRRLQLTDYESVEPRIREYFADRADYQPNRHSVEPQWRELIRERWRDYFDDFHYDLETGEPL